MPKLKVFVSSTCYDLNFVRERLREFILNLGYEPMMSDYNDLLYDTNNHTHTSCVNEVVYCDILIFIIGGRFGGDAVPEALSISNLIEFENFIDKYKIDKNFKYSISFLEVLKAFEFNIPIFTFVLSDVFNDHKTYEKSKKKKNIVKNIQFGSLEKPKSAEYIFEFINFIKKRNKNNALFFFSKIQDIEDTLKNQWADLFQRLISENRVKDMHSSKINNIENEITNIKSMLFASFKKDELQEIIRGTLEYKSVISIIYFLSKKQDKFEYMHFLKSSETWNTILINLYIESIDEFITENIEKVTVIICENDNYYYYFKSELDARFFIYNLYYVWEKFKALKENVKIGIIESVIENVINIEQRHVISNIEPDTLNIFINNSLRHTSHNILPPDRI
jgi:hypothetical protein